MSKRTRANDALYKSDFPTYLKNVLESHFIHYNKFLITVEEKQNYLIVSFCKKYTSKKSIKTIQYNEKIKVYITILNDIKGKRTVYSCYNNCSEQICYLVDWDKLVGSITHYMVNKFKEYEESNKEYMNDTGLPNWWVNK